VIVVDADGTETASFADSGPAYGVRFTADGNLLVAHVMSGVIASIGPDGSSTNFVTGIGGVNGLYPDLDGNVWVTDFGSVRRYDAAGTPTMIVGGGEASGANGIVFDPDRSVAFFTNYGAGRVAKVDIGEDGSPGDVTALGTVGGARFDGLSLDACGNLYVVDNNLGDETVYRLMLDEDANAVGELTDIVDGGFPTNVANAQFGRGTGFEATGLYVTGTPGVVYRLDVGVPGAEIPLP
jgi:sugar lactone lactonase YvrE